LQLEQERAKSCAEREYEKHRQEMEKLDFQARLREQEAKPEARVFSSSCQAA